MDQLFEEAGRILAALREYPGHYFTPGEIFQIFDYTARHSRNYVFTEEKVEEFRILEARCIERKKKEEV